MAKIEDLGEVISTDVLIVGGGISGLVAAVKAKEESSKVEVLLVDKQTIGWSGKAPKGGGFTLVLTEGEDADDFVEYHVRNIGYYLNDQELLYSWVTQMYAAVEQLSAWGVRVPKNADGKLNTMKCPLFDPRFKYKWSIAGIDLDVLFPLRARARKTGVKTLNKIQVVELLKQDDRIVGTVGFNLIDGRFYIIKAKATILANGSCNYKAKRMWHSGCGDGIGAAYRAGAEIRNAEFGNFFDVHRKDNDGPAFDYTALYNALGENISLRYIPVPRSDIPSELVLGMEKEVKEGRGPIYFDPSAVPDLFKPLSDWPRPNFHNFFGRTISKELKYGAPPSARVEVSVALNAELSPIRVDHEMKTSLAGLWAIGDTSQMGSAIVGAVYSPPAMIRGIGLGLATRSGMWGGSSAARFASQASAPKVSEGEVKRLKEVIFAPMGRTKGFSAEETIYGIQDVMCRVQYNLRRSKERLEEGLSKIEKVQQRLPELWAKDGHSLGKCHEARNIAVCGEMTLRAALTRTESRGTHFREDYPNRDDKNWLKWTIIREKSGKMVVSTEPVPIEKYKFKP
jgi:succinate dehydrogenase/fumarate reductase flavoprotein subunit